MNILGTALSWFFGGSKSGDVVDKLDELYLSAEEKGQMDMEDLAKAREYLNYPPLPGFINQVVDAASRLVRPGVTYWLLGGWAGMWALPPVDAIDPFWQSMAYLVLTFWFGGRMVMKDVPNMLATLSKLKKGS